MISDLLTLRKELISAADDQDVADKKAEFNAQVTREIAALFDDPQYLQRRRSFGVIRKRLGVFDENDPDLKAILFSMGARVHKGEGEAALWELIYPDTPTTSHTRRKRPFLVRLGLAALVCAVVLIAVNALMVTILGTSLRDVAQGLIAPPPTLQSCLIDANGTMTEILRCNQTHG
ncbi:hypothetical protein ACERZ8_18595 [Tateyamaria armeniaca]|uniref:Uncharacterized protein n=1 Tax=Tateyamaria armeniaca TaxID=2518930 RepID=A0ABW8UXV9_9RHOB